MGGFASSTRDTARVSVRPSVCHTLRCGKAWRRRPRAAGAWDAGSRPPKGRAGDAFWGRWRAPSPLTFAHKSQRDAAGLRWL